MAHTWQLQFFTYSILDIPWRLTHLTCYSVLTTPKTRPLILNSAIFFFSTQADFIPLTIRYFLILTGLIDYINIKKQLKEVKQFHNADENQKQQ